MSEQDLTHGERAHLYEIYQQDPRVERAAKFLVNLQAFQIGHEEVVAIPIEGTDMTTSTIPTTDEVRQMESQVREHLTMLCDGHKEIGLDIRDKFLFKMFDEKGLWPTNDEDK
jgi:hypothetical protein